MYNWYVLCFSDTLTPLLIFTQEEKTKWKETSICFTEVTKKIRSWTWGLMRPQQTQSFRLDEVMCWGNAVTHAAYSSPLWDVLTSPGDGDRVFPRTAGVILVGEHPILTGELLHWLLDALWNRKHTHADMWYVCTSWKGTNLCAVIWGYINKTE